MTGDRFMKRIRITRRTDYSDHSLVTLGTHRALPRPREGHDEQIEGSEQVCVAVARDPEKAMPFSGAWRGMPGAFDRMEISVQVVSL